MLYGMPVGVFLLLCTVQTAAQDLCPDEGSFTSGGSLVSTSGGTCSRQIYASCIVNCPSGEIRTVSCNPDYNWNDPDPCIACPDSFPPGSLSSSGGPCYRRPNQYCDVYCSSTGDTRQVYCSGDYTWDNQDPCADTTAVNLCPDSFTSGGSLGGTCSREQGQWCDIYCASGEQRTVYCNPDYTWNEPDPCAGTTAEDLCPDSFTFYGPLISSSGFTCYRQPGDTCFIDCTPDDRRTVYCNADYTWDNSDPCAGTTAENLCPDSFTSYGPLISSSDSTCNRQPGDTCFIDCTSLDRRTVYCNADYTWDNPDPCADTTAVNLCPESFTSGGSLGGTCSREQGQWCDIYCASGEQRTVYCNPDYTWNEPDPCAGTTAEDLCPDSFTFYGPLISSSGFTCYRQPGDTCFIDCTPDDRRTVYCNADYTWDNSDPCAGTTAENLCPDSFTSYGPLISSSDSTCNRQPGDTCFIDCTSFDRRTVYCNADYTWDNPDPCADTTAVNLCPDSFTSGGSLGGTCSREQGQWCDIYCASGEQRTVYCNPDYTWNEPDPCAGTTAEDLCPDSFTFYGPLISSSGFTCYRQPGDTCFIDCTPDDRRTVYCNADYTWDNSDPCVGTTAENLCPDSFTSYGPLISSSDSTCNRQPGDTCFIDCTSFDRRTVYCNADYTWNNPDPCAVNLCPDSFTSGGSLGGTCSREQGQWCDIYCASGEQRTVYCNPDYTWNEPDPCAGTTAEDLCPDSFTFYGPLISSSGFTCYRQPGDTCFINCTPDDRRTVYCNADYTWDNSDPCAGTTAENLCPDSFTSHGPLISSSDSTCNRQPGDTCFIDCTSLDRRTVYCNADYTWDNPDPCADTTAVNLCPDSFTSGGSLGGTCSREQGKWCDIYCASGEQRTVYCNPDYTWNEPDPCAGTTAEDLCPDSFTFYGPLISSSGFTCYRQPGDTCFIDCTPDDRRTVYCNADYTWDNSDPCAGTTAENLCPDSFTSYGPLISSSDSTCNRQPGDTCFIDCTSLDRRTVYCNADYTWDNPDPCADTTAVNLCPDSFTSRGSLGGTCSREQGQWCDIYCASGEQRTVYCNPDYTWNEPDPCAGTTAEDLCPDSFTFYGPLISSSGFTCYRQPGDTCFIDCTPDDRRTVYCNADYTWDNSDPCAGTTAENLCPDSFTTYGPLISSSDSTCNRQPGDTCFIDCTSLDRRTVYCNADYTWDNPDPCADTTAVNLCPDSFTSGGSLGGTCSREQGQWCDIYCASGEQRTVYCNPDYTWNEPDPCAGTTAEDLCPDSFTFYGPLISSSGFTCYRQPGDTCFIDCTPDDRRTVYCNADYTWDNSDPCAGTTAENLCPDSFTSYGPLISSSDSTCNRQPGDTCFIDCTSLDRRTVSCNADYTWDNPDPCAGTGASGTTSSTPSNTAQFRLFVSDTLGDVYSVDESGAISLEPVYYPAAGIAIDPLLSKTDTPKLVFGNSSVYSQYITGGTAEDVFKPSDYGGNATRMALDPTTRNVFYISASDASPFYNISVVSPAGDYVTLLSGYENLRAIAIHPERGWLFYSAGVTSYSPPYIGFAYMDGSETYSLFYLAVGALPNGLAVDYTNDMLYWTDSGFMNIERCYLSAGVDGCETTRNIIMDATNLPFAPYNILVDGDFLYYNYDSMSTTYIARVRLSSMFEETPIVIPTSGRLNAIAVYSENFLQILDHPYYGCSERKGLGECSHLCLASLMGPVCKCHEGVSLQFNGVTCEGATLCTDYIPGVSLSTACFRHKYEECEYDCTNSGTTYTSGITSARPKLRCEEGGQWNNSIPCEAFRLYVTDNSLIYAFDESGIQIDLFDPAPLSASEQVFGFDVDTFTLPGQIFEPSLIYSSFDTASFATYFHKKGFESPDASDQFSAYDTKAKRMAIDPTSGNYFYITKDPYGTLSNISVHSQQRYGSQLTLISGLNGPMDIVIHAEQGLLFWSDISFGGRPVINSASMDGTGVTSIVTENITTPNGLAISYNEYMLYWTDYSSIQKCDFYGGYRTEFYHSSWMDLKDIVIDGNTVYLTDSSDASIFKIDMHGSPFSIEVFANAPAGLLDAMAIYSTYQKPISYDCQDRNGLGDCSDLCLQTPTGRTCACFNGGHLKEDGRTCDNSGNFICEGENATLSCSDDPGTVIHITFANYGRTSTAVCIHPTLPSKQTDCHQLIEHSLAMVQGECEGKVSCQLFANNDVFGEPCHDTYKYLEVRHECKPTVTASVDFRLYVTSYNDRQIYAYDELGNLVETSFPMADPIMGIAFDRFTSNYTVTPTSPSFVFSTVNVMGGSDLYRQYADSIIYTPQLLFSESGATVERLVIDPASGNIFYIAQPSSGTSSNISLYSPQTADHVTLITDLTDPTDIMLHTEQRRLFWSDVGIGRLVIEMAYLDGSDRQVLVDQVIPHGLALDNAGHVLYWTDRSSYFIESWDFVDGNRGETIFPDSSHGPYILDVLIDGNILYYTTELASDIMMIDLGGSQMESVQFFTAISGSNIQVRAVSSANKRHIMAVTSTEAASQPKYNSYEICKKRDGRGDCSNVCLPNMMDRTCRCDDSVYLEPYGRTCPNADLCPLNITDASLDTLCTGHKYEECWFSCNYPYTSSFSYVRCEGNFWNVSSPCTSSTTSITTPSTSTNACPHYWNVTDDSGNTVASVNVTIDNDGVYNRNATINITIYNFYPESPDYEWFGFGISYDQFMSNSDMVMVKMDADGTWNITDRFAFEQAEPIIDGHKDVFKETLNTIDGSSSTYTLLFHRPVYTYDSQDVELDNEKYFLFARGYQAGWVIEKHNFRAVSSSYYLGCHGSATSSSTPITPTAVDFRLYVTSYDDRQIYAYDEFGNLVETSFPMADPIMAIAFDRFTSNYTVTPTIPSFVFSTVNTIGGSDIYRQYADSMPVTPQILFSESGASVERLVIDPASGNIFYIAQPSSGSGNISLYSPQTGDHVKLITDITDPTDIVLHTEQRRLFWSDVGSDRSVIEMAYLDGSDRQVLVDQVIPHGLALDNAGHILYWTDRYTYSVESWSFVDGTRGEPILPDSSHGPYILDVLIDGNILYYTTESSSEIMIIELGGSQMQSVQLFSAIYASNIQERAVASANKRHIMAVTSTEAASRPKYNSYEYCKKRDGRGDCSNVCLPGMMDWQCRCDDNVHLEQPYGRTCPNAELCPLNITDAYIDTLCAGHKYEECSFTCSNPYTSSFTHIRCEGIFWNVSNPCTGLTTTPSTPTSVFRLYVTSSVDRTVYVLDETGMQTDMFEASSPVRGIAVDYFSSPQSFIYSVDSIPTAQWAYVFRSEVGYIIGNQLFAVGDDRAIIERVEVDPNSGNIYYTGIVIEAGIEVSGYIGLYRQDGSQSELISGLVRPRDIVLSPDDGMIFWSDVRQNVISSSGMNGSEVSVIRTGVLAYGLAIDNQASMLYWADRNSFFIEWSDFYGNHMGTLTTLPSTTLVNDIMIHGRVLFYTSETSNYINTISLDESQYARRKRQTQISYYYVPGASSLDAIAIYNSTSGQTQQTPTPSITTTRTPTNGFRLYVTDNVMIHTFSESGIQIDSYPPSYSDAERVYGLDIDTFTPSDSIFEPSLIYSTFDTFTTRFYERAFEWSNGLELFSTDGIQAKRMAIDPTSGNYFYITKDPYDALSNISVHSQYSHGSQLTIISGLNDPLDIVLHAEQGLLFWSDLSSTGPVISSAFMDGSGITQIVTEGITTAPYGLAISYDENMLYWTNGSSIQKCDFYGSSRTEFYYASGMTLKDIVIDEYTLYFTESSDSSIFKVDIDMYGASLGMAVFANAPVGFLDAMAIYSTIPKPVSPYCQQRNGLGDCSDLCLPTPTGRNCACFNGGQLMADGRTCDNAIVCIASFSSGSQSPSCSGHKFEICDIMCESGNTMRVECGEYGTWNDTNPCSGSTTSITTPSTPTNGFRLYVTDNSILYIFNETGSRIESYDPRFYSETEQVLGFDIDTFTPSDSLFEPSLIYSTFEPESASTRFYEKGFQWYNGLELFSVYNTQAKRMAVDPTSGNYFYITKDPYGALSNISVHSQYSYGSQLTLISGLNDPLDIVLHAEQGLMFWSDLSSNGHIISSAFMDGSGITQIIAEGIATAPYGLAISYYENMLYWTDGSSIQKCDFYGSSRTEFYYASGMMIKDIVIDAYTLYFTDSSDSSIFMVDIDMYGASLGMAVFANAPVGFLDAMAIYSSIPKPVSPYCQQRNGLGDCSDLCLPTPTGRICACFNGGQLMADGRTCDNGILCDLTSFSSGSPMSDCSGHQFEICDMMCESGNMVRVECGNSGAWNDTNPCSGSSDLCPAEFPSGGTLTSHYSPSCSRQRGDMCFVTCDNGNTKDVFCTESGDWDIKDPCSVFRLYVSSSVDRTVYVLDEIGMQTDMFEVSSPVRGIAVDYFSSPHSFIYSVDRETTGQGAYVLRTYVGDTVGNQLFALPEDGAIAVRMTVDPNSGNIYYTAVIMDVTDYGYIGLYRLDSGQSVLIPGLTRPRDIVISPDDGMIFWSDVGQNVISSAGMDGSDYRDIVIGVSAYGLAIDYQASLLYWANRNSSSIEWCDFYGSPGGTLTQLPNNILVNDIMFHGRLLYYTSEGSSMIYTIPLDESQYARKKRQTQTSYYVSGASSLDAIAIYNSTSAQTQQLPCPSGSIVDVTQATGCLLCPRGTYQDVATSESCQICPPGFSTPYPGAISPTDCIVDCEPGSFWEDGVCVTCPPGWVQPEADQVECILCPEGTQPNSITVPTECDSAYLCSETFTSGGLLTSASLGTCYREPGQTCDVQCPSGVTRPVYCYPNGTWDDPDPCLVMNPDFRILATSASTFEIYSFNEVGMLMDTFYSPYSLPVLGISMDHFMPMSSSRPHNPSFVYSTSVDSDGHAGFYRQFLNGTGPVYITSVREVTVERIAVDSASGNIYYTALRHGSFANLGVIGVITPNGDHLTLKDDLSHPVDLVLHGEQGRMYWSDIGTFTIASAYMNGTGLEVTASGVEVYGLALDHTDFKLYWTEVSQHQEGSSSSVKSYYLNGGTTIETEKQYYDRMLKDILIDGQHWYYTLEGMPEIGKVNKSVIEDESVFANVPGVTNLNAIAVYSWDSSAIPRSYACNDRDGLGDCSTICLPSSFNTHSCHCPDGEYIYEDGKTCENATLCPDTITRGEFQEGCSFYKFAVCGVRCNDKVLTVHMQCTEEGYWNDQYPCSEPTTTLSTPSFNETATPGPSGSTQSEPYSTEPTPSESTGPTPSEPTGPAPSESTGPIPSESTGPTPSEQTGPTPSEPTGPTPSEPTGPTPSEPTGPTPAESTRPTPSEPTGPTPSESTGPTPSEPTGPTPSEQTGPTHSEPTGPTPSEPTGPTHAEPTGPTPSEPTRPTPLEPTGPTPSEPTGPTLSEPTEPTPSEPTGPTPLEPTGPTPSEPSGPTPSEPTGQTPSEQTGPTPSEPTGPTPSEPTGSMPKEPTGPTPSEPSGLTPSEPTGPTSTEPTGPMPSEPTGPTPSEPTEPTPTEPTGQTPSEPTRPTPTEPTGPTPSEPTGQTPSEPTGPTPTEPTGPTSSESSGPTPSGASWPTPSTPTGSTPSGATGSTAVQETESTGGGIGSTDGQVTGSTGGQVTGSTGGQVTGSTGDQVTGSTGSHVTGSTGGQVTGSTGGQVTKSTGDQVSGSTGGHVTGSTGGQVNGSTGGQVTGSTGGQVNGSTGGQVTGSTGGQVTGSTGGQVTGSTGGQVSGSTGGQVTGSTGGQVTGSTGGQITGSTAVQTSASSAAVTTTVQTTTAGSATIWSKSQILLNTLLILFITAAMNVCF